MAEESQSCAMGFHGCLIVNPIQLPWCNRVFSPSPEELAHAKDIIETVERIQIQGANETVINGKMVGPPMYKRALKVMELEKLIKEYETIQTQRKEGKSI